MFLDAIEDEELVSETLSFFYLAEDCSLRNETAPTIMIMIINITSMYIKLYWRAIYMSTLLVYASMTGNTEEMAEAVAEGVKSTDESLTMKEVMDAYASEMADYDGILLGAYTWGDGELPDEFLDFFEEMDDVDLTGKKAAVFGSCDSSYAQYGAAVDILIDKLRERGCEVILDGLKVELTPKSDEKEQCRQFGSSFIGKLRG